MSINELKKLSKINARIVLCEFAMQTGVCEFHYRSNQMLISKLANLKIILKHWNDAQFN